MRMPVSAVQPKTTLAAAEEVTVVAAMLGRFCQPLREARNVNGKCDRALGVAILPRGFYRPLAS
jgi:hypothetical protein